MKKVLVASLVAMSVVSLPVVAAEKPKLSSAFSKSHPDRIVTVADFENFNACVNGVGGTNQREIAQGLLNPNGLTISNVNVPATGVLRKDGDPTTCVATQFVASN